MRDGSKLSCHIWQFSQVRFPGFSFKSPKFTLLNCKFLGRFYFQFSNLRHGSRFRLVVTPSVKTTPTEISVCLGYAEKSAIVVITGVVVRSSVKKLPFADVSPNLDCAPLPPPTAYPHGRINSPSASKYGKIPLLSKREKISPFKCREIWRYRFLPKMSKPLFPPICG